MKRRLWVFLRESTLWTAVEALKRIASRGRNIRQDDAAEDMRRAKRLSETEGLSREDIEDASRKHDDNQFNGP